MPQQTNILPPRYRGARRIGRGGMGEIFRATDDTLGRAVAVKVLAEPYAEDEDVRGRFTREALAAARLSGEPNIVTIFDVGEWGDRPFIVMEYMSGGSLEEQLRRGTPPVARALGWVEQTGRALDAAHDHGVVHRDVKPANLLLDRNGEVQVADFGIASAAGLAELTQPGTVLGTAGYLSPEQARGERATPASDRYALAVVAWELLAGRRPFAGPTPTAEAVAHASAPVPPISATDPSLPRELDAVFERALAKEPERRPETCSELAAAIRDAFDRAAGTTRALAPQGPPTAPTIAVPSRAAGRPGRVAGGRDRRLPALAAAAAVALVAGGIALATALGGDGGGTAAPTLVTTVVRRAPGTTVEKAVTVTVDSAPATTGAGGVEPAGSYDEAVSLTDQATALMRAGDWAGALPLAQRALAYLQGSGDTYEGYASFNVGHSLVGLGRCDEALPYLQRRLQLLGPHPAVTDALARCGVSAKPGKGHGKGKKGEGD